MSSSEPGHRGTKSRTSRMEGIKDSKTSFATNGMEENKEKWIWIWKKKTKKMEMEKEKEKEKVIEEKGEKKRSPTNFGGHSVP